MTKIQLLATLLALFIFAMLGACSNEDYPEPDVFKVTPDLRTRINTGIKWLPAQKRGFSTRHSTLFFTNAMKWDQKILPINIWKRKSMQI